LRTEEGKVYGPVPRAELVQWAREGRISAGCLASPSDSDHWLPVTGVLTEVVWPASATTPPNPQMAAPQPLYEVRPRTSDRSRLVAGLLGLLLPLVGINGAHRLYTGHIGLGILMMITCGGCGIWQLIDTILVFAGSVRDVDGLPLAP
jgi:TM2 domain-containing membrane protein YozV